MSEDPDPELLESLLSQFTNHNSGKRSRVVALGREKRARTSRKPPAAACGPQPLPGPDGPWQVELPASPTLFSSSARTGSTARRGDAGDPFLGIPVDDFLEVSLDAATLQGGSPISQYLQDDDFSDRDSQTAGSPSGGSGSACRSTSGSLSQPASPLMPVPEGFGDPIYLVSLDPAQPGQTGFLMFPQVDSGSGLSMPLHLPLSGFSPVQGPNVLPASCAKQPLEAEPALIQLPDGPVIQAVAIPAGAALPLTASVAAREPTPIVPSVVPAPVASTAPPAHVIEPPSTKRKRGRPRKSVQEPAVAPQPGLHAVQSPSNVPNPPTGILLNNGQPAFAFPQIFMTQPAHATVPSSLDGLQRQSPANKVTPNSLTNSTSPSGQCEESGRVAKKARSSHNEIEKRYRENINERMRELRDVVPALAAIAANEGDGGMDEDDGIAANKAGSGNAAKKLHKAAILKGATDHIRHLTLENDRLRIELNSLRGLLASAAASVSVPGWHAQPMSTTSVGDPEAPAGTVAPISIMILAGVMFLGRAGSVPEVLSLGPESPALGSHTDVGKVLGVNGTGFGFANTSQPFDDNLLSWIGNLVRLLLALYCVMHILLSVFVFPKKGRKCETNAREMGNGVGVDARRCSSQVAAVVNAAAQLALSGKFDESAGLFERATGIAATDADCSDHAWLVRDPDLAREFWVSRSWSAEVADSETTADVFTVTGLAFRQWMLRRALIAALKATVSGSLETSFTSPELICRNLVYDCEVNKDVSVLPAAMVARAVLAACCGAPSSDVTKATTLAVEHSKEYYLASFGAAVSVTLIAMRGGCEDARRKALIAAQQAVAACAARRRHSVRSSRANSLNHSVDLVLELFLCVALAVCIKSDIVLEEPSLDLLSAHILRLLAATPSNMKADVEPVLSFVESMIV